MRANLVTGAPAVREIEAGSIVQAYLDLVAEGESPDLEEFLGRVPEELREEVFAGIDQATANPPEVVDASHLLPVVEVSVDTLPRPRRLERWAFRLVPASIRSAFTADWAFARPDRSLADSVGDLLDGIAQHAPLREADPHDEPRTPVALRGWIAWRCTGTLLFLGAVLGSALAFAGGALLLGVGVGTAVVRRDGADDTSRRLVNAVLGGATVSLVALLGLGVLTVACIALSALTSWTALAAGAVRFMVVAATFVAMIVTASGWAPAPWWPKRLVRVD